MSSEPESNVGFTFAHRLRHQLQLKGKKDSPTTLAREFNLRWRGVPVTTNAVRKWMLGESFPTMDKMEILANMLGVAPDWLRWGETRYAPTSATDRAKSEYQVREALPFENMEKAVIQDYRLLNSSNQKIVFSLMEIMLKEQKSSA
jgi:transcriptional regulator with XRE-family HTH domain